MPLDSHWGRIKPHSITVSVWPQLNGYNSYHFNNTVKPGVLQTLDMCNSKRAKGGSCERGMWTTLAVSCVRIQQCTSAESEDIVINRKCVHCFVLKMTFVGNNNRDGKRQITESDGISKESLSPFTAHLVHIVTHKWRVLICSDVIGWLYAHSTHRCSIGLREFWGQDNTLNFSLNHSWTIY